MDGSLNQPSRVQEEGAMRCKLLFRGKKTPDVSGLVGTLGISIG
jgi:hypothetical protein